MGTARDKYWGQKASTMPHGHFLSLLLVVLIAMVMEYKYSNNDLHYVVDNPPHVDG